MDENNTSSHSVFIGHVYLQQAGLECCSEFGLCNQIYLIVEDVRHNGAIAIVNCNCLNIALRGNKYKAEKEITVLVTDTG